MKLGIRLFFVFFLLNGIAAFFLLRVFTTEIRPSVRDVMEDMLVDTANILAELASDELAQGQLAQGRFAEHVNNYARRPIDARIWGLSKQSLDYRIYVTDRGGKVVFDSVHLAQGQDYSQWRDVALTLRGEYGARATREVQTDDRTSVMYVAAPVLHEGRIIGVLTVAKPISTVQRFIDRAEQKIMTGGVWLLMLSATVGVLVTIWVVWNIRRLRNYARSVQSGGTEVLPRVPGELGELAQAMQTMRERLDGREYIENYVRALTHELKSPVAAVRASGELLQENLPEAQRREFAGHVVAQSERLQRLVDRLLELSKLEHLASSGQGLHVVDEVYLVDSVRAAVAAAAGRFAARQMTVHIEVGEGGASATVRGDTQAIALAVSNLLENALDFAPSGSQVTVCVTPRCIAVQDQGPGVPDYALPRLGERFFTTARPNGERSGSGLGLAIVRQIMALHRGRLQLTNANGFRAEMEFPAG
ncbi:MAG: two-component system sensor histidine kinase CreC [Hylemonella sp.]|uniref:two-component system sensor histidine kinase CreC n=1 Tax=Hylemonella sp. TaxID=2066020 RepID=UPI0022BF64E7|nr:two-component system sensor histidine kinase CreC [Hylemonella sp.]MCZ8251108.1 two-component system sensor histidine kinase CreC [Hylemonella sp.]